MPFRASCQLPFRKLIAPFTLTGYLPHFERLHDYETFKRLQDVTVGLENMPCLP